MGRQTAGRMTLAELVFSLVQARHKEKIREANGVFGLTPCTLQCWGYCSEKTQFTHVLLSVLVNCFIICQKNKHYLHTSPRSTPNGAFVPFSPWLSCWPLFQFLFLLPYLHFLRCYYFLVNFVQLTKPLLVKDNCKLDEIWCCCIEAAKSECILILIKADTSILDLGLLQVLASPNPLKAC